jgi:hypothetical protein
MARTAGLRQAYRPRSVATVMAVHMGMGFRPAEEGSDLCESLHSATPTRVNEHGFPSLGSRVPGSTCRVMYDSLSSVRITLASTNGSARDVQQLGVGLTLLELVNVLMARPAQGYQVVHALGPDVAVRLMVNLDRHRSSEAALALPFVQFRLAESSLCSRALRAQQVLVPGLEPERVEPQPERFGGLRHDSILAHDDVYTRGTQ